MRAGNEDEKGLPYDGRTAYSDWKIENFDLVGKSRLSDCYRHLMQMAARKAESRLH